MTTSVDVLMKWSPPIGRLVDTKPDASISSCDTKLSNVVSSSSEETPVVETGRLVLDVLL